MTMLTNAKMSSLKDKINRDVSEIEKKTDKPKEDITNEKGKVAKKQK